jgi:hypothetical protein
MAKMELSKFKKMSSTKDFTVMKHPDGHTINIAHKALSPEMKKHLDSLPHFDEGGAPYSAEAGAAISSGVQGKKVSAPKQNSGSGESQGYSGDIEQASVAEKPANEDPAYNKMFADGGRVDTVSKQLPMSNLYMAQGGVIKDDSGKTLGQLISYPDSQPTPSPSPSVNPVQKATGGAIEAYADGGDVPQDNGQEQAPNQNVLPPAHKQDSEEQIYADAAQNQPTGPNAQYASLYQNELDQMRQNNPGQPEVMNQQQALDAAIRDKQAIGISNQKVKNQQQADYNTARVINNKKAQLGLPPDQTPPNPNQPADASQNLPQTSDALTQNLNQLQQQQPVQDPYGMNQAYNMWMQGMNQRLGGIYKEAAATGQLGTNQAAVLQQQVENQKQAMAHVQDQYNQLNQERLHTLDDLDNQHIDADRYVKNMTTGDKVKSTIGLILGGFGAMAGQQNLAYQALQNNITRDIDAQKSNLGKSESMLNNNLQQFGNLRDATQWQHIMSQDIIAHQLQQQAASMAPGMAQAKADQLAGQLRQDSSQQVAQMGMRRAMMNLTAGSQSPQQFNSYLSMLRVMNPEMAKEMERRYVPNVGVASVPVPQAVRDQLNAHQQLDSTIKDLHQFVNSHSTMVPGTPEYNTGVQKALALQAGVREGLLGTVYKAGEQPLLDKFISSNPAGMFKTLRTIPQLNELLSANTRRFNQLKQSVGLPVPPGVNSSGVYQPKTFKKVK